jgi:hypothetical protein
MGYNSPLAQLLDSISDELRNLAELADMYDSVNEYTITQSLPEIQNALAEFGYLASDLRDFLDDRTSEIKGRELEEIANSRLIQIANAIRLPRLQGLMVNLAKPNEHADVPDQISVAVYLNVDDMTISQKILDTVDRLVTVLGYSEPEEVDLQKGSIFRRSWSRAKIVATSDQMKERLEKLERAIEVQGLILPEADAVAKYSQAVQALVHSLSQVETACIRIHSILLIKYQTAQGSVILNKTLTTAEIRALERYPEIQKEPSKALEMLAFSVDSLQAGVQPLLGDPDQ